jgi:hypothetical protein
MLHKLKLSLYTKLKELTNNVTSTCMGSVPSVCIEYTSRVSASMTNQCPVVHPMINILPSKENAADCTGSCTRET